MTLPGYVVDIVPSPPNSSEFTNISTAMWLGKATTPGFAEVYSYGQFTDQFGVRNPASPTYDAVETYFREGGGHMYAACADLAATDEEIIALLENFDKGLGPAQLASPGIPGTAGAVQIALAAMTEDNDRVAVLDAPDTDVVATATAAAGLITSEYGDRFSAMFWPWDVVPGILGGAPRIVPPSARICGNIARNDMAGCSSGDAAAGRLGIANRVYTLSQPKLADSDRSVMNAAGVNVTRMVYQWPRTYGWRSLASQTTNYDWSWFGASRCIMAIKNTLSIIAENFVFSKLDGQLATCSRFNSAMVGGLMPYWKSGDLFGMTSKEAFSVDTGPAQNTTDTFFAGELHGHIGLRCSGMAEGVFIDVAKIPTTEALAA